MYIALVSCFDVSGPTRGELEHRYYMMNQPIPEHCFMDGGTVFDIRRMKAAGQLSGSQLPYVYDTSGL